MLWLFKYQTFDLAILKHGVTGQRFASPQSCPNSIQ
jgi:hypothetical protein